MYIQITRRCNMQCEHCCYSCTDQGQDMSQETFIEACKLAEDFGHVISIGGGEPTIHPLFWAFIGISLAYHDAGVVWLATNGKETDTALRLAKLAKKGVISVDLSLDTYHEPIDGRVVEAFTTNKRGEYISSNSDDFRSIRNVTQHRDPLPFGRAASWSLEDKECVCNDLLIEPDGSIWACGCQKVQYGTVFDPQLPEEYPDEWCSEHYDE